MTNNSNYKSEQLNKFAQVNQYRKELAEIDADLKEINEYLGRQINISKYIEQNFEGNVGQYLEDNLTDEQKAVLRFVTPEEALEQIKAGKLKVSANGIQELVVLREGIARRQAEAQELQERINEFKNSNIARVSFVLQVDKKRLELVDKRNNLIQQIDDLDLKEEDYQDENLINQNYNRDDKQEDFELVVKKLEELAKLEKKVEDLSNKIQKSEEPEKSDLKKEKTAIREQMKTMVTELSSQLVENLIKGHPDEDDKGYALELYKLVKNYTDKIDSIEDPNNTATAIKDVLDILKKVFSNLSEANDKIITQFIALNSRANQAMNAMLDGKAAAEAEITVFKNHYKKVAATAELEKAIVSAVLGIFIGGAVGVVAQRFSGQLEKLETATNEFVKVGIEEVGKKALETGLSLGTAEAQKQLSGKIVAFALNGDDPSILKMKSQFELEIANKSKKVLEKGIGMQTVCNKLTTALVDIQNSENQMWELVKDPTMLKILAKKMLAQATSYNTAAKVKIAAISSGDLDFIKKDATLQFLKSWILKHKNLVKDGGTTIDTCKEAVALRNSGFLTKLTFTGFKNIRIPNKESEDITDLSDPPKFYNNYYAGYKKYWESAIISANNTPFNKTAWSNIIGIK